MTNPSTSEALEPASPALLDQLLANQHKFLAFLENRVGSRSIAQEILQSAFVRGLEKGGSVRNEESAVAWFYRLLRNALVDYYRKTAGETRQLEPLLDADAPVEEALHTEVCRCVNALLPTLKPEYRRILEQVDLEETPLSNVAQDLAITPNNASVRLHRARQALRTRLEQCCGSCATHGCFNCTCNTSQQAT